MKTLTLVAFLVAQHVSAQQRFPDLMGETADGKTVQFPTKSAQGYTIIGLAYSTKSQGTLEEWFEPAYLRFVAKHGLFAGAYQCAVYFVPLFTGMNKAAYEPSMKRFRKSATPEVVGHVVFSKADIETLRLDLGLTEKDVPYLFVLDREGIIRYRTQGAYSDEKLEAMEEVLLE